MRRVQLMPVRQQTRPDYHRIQNQYAPAMNYPALGRGYLTGQSTRSRGGRIGRGHGRARRQYTKPKAYHAEMLQWHALYGKKQE